MKSILVAVLLLSSIGSYGLSPCGFTASNHNMCAGAFLNLMDTTTGHTGTSWDFILAVGGVVDTFYNSLGTWSNPSNATASLTIIMTDTIGGAGCTVADSSFRIYPKPEIRGAFTTSVTCPGSCVYWLDSSVVGGGTSLVTYDLYWGDGSYDSVPDLCHMYSNNGTYSPEIYITNSAGCVADTTFSGGITVLATCPFSAGPDQTICLNSTATMAAIGTGEWTLLPSNPAFTIIDSPASPTTIMSGFPIVGVYSFVWTTAMGRDTMTVTVTACPFSAGPDQTTCRNSTITTAATDTGTWSPLGTNPTPTIIDSVASPTTHISGFSMLGVYGFVWTSVAGGQWDTLIVTVDSICPCHLAGYISRGPVIFGQENDTIVITSPERNDTSPLGYYLYHWTCVNWPGNLYDVQGADSIDFIYSYTDYFINNGIYGVTVYDTALGCSQTFLDTVSALSCNLHDSVSYTYLDSGRYQFVAYTNTGSANILYSWIVSGLDPLYNQAQTYMINLGGRLPDTINVRLASGRQFVVLQVYDSLTGCGNIDSIAFNVPNYAYADIDTGHGICLGGQVWLNAFASDGLGSFTALPTNPGHTGIQVYNQYAPPIQIYIDSFVLVGTYAFVWSDSGVADTVYVTVNAPPTISVSPSSVSICRGLSTILTATGSPPGGAYDWWTINDTTASSVSVSPASSKDYIVDYAAGGCGVADTIRVTVTNCADTVWPGDADANHVVDNNDLLPIGLGYDSTGPIRAVQGIVWQHDSATYWANSFTSYFPVVNFCHADCNGDGIINADDTLAIVTNFGRTHLSAHIAQAWRSGLPPIYPVVSPDTALTGDTLSIFVNLGDSLMPAANVYGVAFTVNYDALVIDTTTVSIAFGSSWFGSPSNSISISKTFAGQGIVKAAVTRIDHTNISGHGLIATLRAIVTTDNIDGKEEYYQFRCSISDVRLIDDQGNIISVNEGADSSQVGFTPLSIADIGDLNSAVMLYPNPAKSYITVACSKTKVNGIEMINILGETVRQSSYTDKYREHTIDVQGLSSGIYYALIKTEAGTVTRKVTIY